MCPVDKGKGVSLNARIIEASVRGVSMGRLFGRIIIQTVNETRYIEWRGTVYFSAW